MKMIILLIILVPLNVALRAECVRGNCVNGEGTYVWVSGDRYMGRWVDGKLQGHGTLIWAHGASYVGNFYKNRMHGYGLFSSKGKSIFGWWESGVYKGK